MTQSKNPPELDSIRVFPLYGDPSNFFDYVEAITFVKAQDDVGRSAKPLARIEVLVRYKDGTRVEAECPNKHRALEFLENRHKGMI